MRITVSTGVILAVGLVPVAWTVAVWLADLVTRGNIWDENEVWGVMAVSWVAAPVILIGLGKLSFDNRNSN